jgi:2-polyprenyl-6-hydroxyphenyl methylase/3-demethylubiquinone-9 3-methyltransferase
VRLRYIRDNAIRHFQRDPSAVTPFRDLRLLDIGCGGGLLSEPMARLGFEVLGADASEKNIRTASTHAGEQGLPIDYRATSAEQLAAAGAIVGAEYVLGWLPRGTHDWNRFLKPMELDAALGRAGLNGRFETGVVFNPLLNEWSPSSDTDVNYMLVAEKPA